MDGMKQLPSWSCKPQTCWNLYLEKDISLIRGCTTTNCLVAQWGHQSAQWSQIMANRGTGLVYISSYSSLVVEVCTQLQCMLEGYRPQTFQQIQS